jgi:ATP-dependent RNA helicase DeaD
MEVKCGRDRENFGLRAGDVNRHALSLVGSSLRPISTGEPVPSFEELHIHPAIARALEARGWTPDSPGMRDSAPTVARGHNLVAVAPPDPVYAVPALAGILSRVEPGKRGLMVVPPEQLDDWAALLHSLTTDTPLRLGVARGAARALRQLRADALDVLVAPLGVVLTLLSRSALRLDTVHALLVAWPEFLPDRDSLMPLMQDLSREAQRIVYTADPGRVSELVDRYARKALTVGIPPSEAAPAGPVRTVSTSWAGRAHALAETVELLDPESLVVWTADRGQHETIQRLVTTNHSKVQLVTGDAPPESTIVAFDLPTRERLQQLLGAGEVVLLVPAGTEAYVASIASPRRPLQLPGLLDTIQSAESLQRSAIQKMIEGGLGSRSLLTLAPLFERYEAPLVAAALLELWRGSASTAQAAPAAPAEAAATARVWVGAGKKEGVTANDLVAVLTKELGVDRTKIGRIELRDGYSLIELPAQEAEGLAGKLNGTTIRRKRVTARVDRGPSRPSAGASGSRGRPARRPNPR